MASSPKWSDKNKPSSVGRVPTSSMPTGTGREPPASAMRAITRSYRIRSSGRGRSSKLLTVASKV